jgi:hypothetical protein
MGREPMPEALGGGIQLFQLPSLIMIFNLRPRHSSVETAGLEPATSCLQSIRE